MNRNKSMTSDVMDVKKVYRMKRKKNLWLSAPMALPIVRDIQIVRKGLNFVRSKGISNVMSHLSNSGEAQSYAKLSSDFLKNNQLRLHCTHRPRDRNDQI